MAYMDPMGHDSPLNPQGFSPWEIKPSPCWATISAMRSVIWSVTSFTWAEIEGEDPKKSTQRDPAISMGFAEWDQTWMWIFMWILYHFMLLGSPQR